MTRTRNLTIGLVIAGLLGLFDLPSFLNSSDSSDNDAPPFAVSLAATALGVITLVALYFAWRGDLRALWTVVGSRILSALLAVPAFFADISSGIKIVVAVFVVVTLLAVSLIISELRKVQQSS